MKPFKGDALARLRAADVPITSIIDVGVRDKTGELIEHFPDKHHLLFEPVRAFFPDIEKNYAGISHELHPVALSNERGTLYLVELCVLSDGVVTHSQIEPAPRQVDGRRVVNCEPVNVRRFDELGIKVEKNFLLKVDVDGVDFQVMQGFGSTLKDASVVIVEATFDTLYPRMQILAHAGFDVFDIVDLIYYGNGLQQMDLIMLRSDLNTPNVRPKLHPHVAEAWRPFLLSTR